MANHAGIPRSEYEADWFATNGPQVEATQPGGQQKNAAGRGVSAQQYYQDWVANFGIPLRQSDPAGWDRLVSDMRGEGFNVSLDSRNDGLHKGIMLDGNFVKLRDGYDKPIWMPGGNEAGGGAGGGRQAFTPPAAWSESFTAPAWTEKFAGPTQADLDADTSYQEQLKRGQQAIERSAAARGTVLNAGTLKDLSDWTAGTASTEMDKLYGRKANEYGQRYNEYQQSVQQKGNEYNQRYKQYMDAYNQAAGTFGINYGVWNDDVNRFTSQQQNAFNQQLSLAQLGMQGANAATAAGSQYANQGGNAITGGANASAAATMAGANAWGQGIGAAANIAGSLYGMGGGGYNSPYVSAMPYGGAGYGGFSF